MTQQYAMTLLIIATIFMGVGALVLIPIQMGMGDFLIMIIPDSLLAKIAGIIGGE